MEQILFDQLQEKLYFEKMANGLDVYVLPKKGLTKRTPPLRRNTVRLIINLFLRAGRTTFVCRMESPTF